MDGSMFSLPSWAAVKIAEIPTSIFNELFWYDGVMAKQPERHSPAWAEQERAGDLAWIRENLHIFWPSAQLGYETMYQR